MNCCKFEVMNTDINIHVKTAKFERRIKRAAKAAKELKKQIDLINATPIEIRTREPRCFLQVILNNLKAFTQYLTFAKKKRVNE